MLGKQLDTRKVMAVSGVYFAFLKKNYSSLSMYWWIIFVHTFDYEFIKKILINPQVVKYLGLIPWITIGKSVFLAFMVAFYLKIKKKR